MRSKPSMPQRRAALALLTSVAALGACGGGGAEREPFVYATACQVGQDVRPAAAIRLVDAFPRREAFEAPIALTHFGDGSKRLLVQERAGRLLIVHPDGRTTEALDIHDKVYDGFECGFIGLAVHPRHAENGKLYAYYCTEREEDDQTISVIAEWTMRADDRDVVDPASERVLLTLEQPWDNHNGGGMAFGPDGFLYIGFGDGGSGNDPLDSGQDTDSLLGKILRVDVDRRQGDEAYGIPADNPFAGGGGRPEIYAWGFRNPWRFSFDRADGRLWVGDVGQDTLEEIDIVERGKNYGWKVMEGTRCRPGGGDCEREGLELPVVEYDHDVGNSVTGGYVYRGAAVPALVGRYVYADYATRVVFSWQEGEPAPEEPMFVADGYIASFGEDEDGEVYALDIVDGRIYRFEQGMVTPPVPPPARLSATGCFTSLAAMSAAEGVVPYDVTLPFWSDGAVKSRWFVLPDGGRMTPSAVRPFHFPVGTVFIKHFELPSGGAQRRVETRFLIQEELGVRGFTYRWDDDGADASLMSEGATVDVTSDAGAHAWTIPTSVDCTTCHRGRGVLGLDARQLGDAPAAWRKQGLTSERPPTGVAQLVLPDDEAVPVEARARAWLHVNCAYCHDGNGPSGTPLDLRADTPLEAMALCGEPPQRGDLGVADAALLAPGAPERSLVWLRASSRGEHQMPPLASAVVDPRATVVRDWIGELATCP